MNTKIAFAIIFVVGCLCSRQQLDWSSGEAIDYFRSNVRPELIRIEHEQPRADKGKLVSTRLVELFTEGKKRRELTFESTVEKSGLHALMIDRISTGAERYSLVNPRYTATLEKFETGNYGILDYEPKTYEWTFLKSGTDAAFHTVGNFAISDVFEQSFIRFVEGKAVNGRMIFKFDADPNDEKNTSNVVSFVVEFDAVSQLPVKFNVVRRVPLTTGSEDQRNIFEYDWESFPEFGVVAPKRKICTTYNAGGIISKKETTNTMALPLDQFEIERCYTTFYGLTEPFVPRKRWFWMATVLCAAGTALALVSRFLVKRKD